MKRAWLITFLCFLSLANCSKTTANQGEAGADSGTSGSPPDVSAQARRMPVRVAVVERRDVTQTVELTGTAEPWDEFIVSAEISGRIRRILVDEGDWVQEGTVVVELDRELRLLERRSREASLAKKEVELDFARRRLQRGQSLLDRGAISEEEVESLDQRVQIAESEVAIAQLEVTTMEEEIEDTSIPAQASGRVSRRHVSLGETITPGDPLLTIIQENPLKVVTEISESQLASVHKGMRIPLTFDAFPGQPFSALVHFVEPVANPGSRAFPVELRLANPSRRVKPGMAARIRMPAGHFTDVLLVPMDAVLEGSRENHLFRVEDEIARKVSVRLIQRVGAEAIVEGELSPADLVVTSGNINLTDNTPVEVLP